MQMLIEGEVKHLVGERCERDEAKHYVLGKEDGCVMPLTSCRTSPTL